MSKLSELVAKQADLVEKLDRSLLIKSIVPDAFEHGKASSYVVGNPWHPERMRWVLKRGNGSTREFPLFAIPDHLWGGFSRESARQTTRGSVKAWR